MNALAHIRPWFLSRQRREKILAALFLLAVALVWLGLLVDRVRGFSLQVRIVRSDANTQEIYLHRSADDDARYEAAITALNPGSFPPLSEVSAKVEALVVKYSFKRNITPSKAQKHGALKFQSITVTVDGADFFQLRDFQREIATSLPTVHLKQFTLRPASRNPGQASAQLNAKFELEAIEFNR